MKFFDYKFLILLGLSLVVYFIYREVEHLYTKVDKLEKDIKLLSNNTKTSTIELHEEPNPIQQLPLPQKQSRQLPLPQKQQLPQKQLQPRAHTLSQEEPPIPLPISLQSQSHAQSHAQSLQSEVYSVSSKLINIDLFPSKTHLKNKDNILNTIDKNTELTTLEDKNIELNTLENKKNVLIISENGSESSIHLAIYSNDDEHYDDKQDFLLESETCGHKFNYNEQTTILNVETSDDEIINKPISTILNISNDSHESPKSHESQDLHELHESSKSPESPELHESRESRESRESHESHESHESTKSHESHESHKIVKTNEPVELLKLHESPELHKLHQLHKLHELHDSSESPKLPEPVEPVEPVELHESVKLANSAKSSEQKEIYNKKSLDLLKLPEVKNIAERNNVSLTKKINGIIKNKTKNELIDDIISIQPK
jgi:hypothetical protein